MIGPPFLFFSLYQILKKEGKIKSKSKMKCTGIIIFYGNRSYGKIWKIAQESGVSLKQIDTVFLT